MRGQAFLIGPTDFCPARPLKLAFRVRSRIFQGDGCRQNAPAGVFAVGLDEAAVRRLVLFL
jgi:hypothetical protein